jgi:hypothetical protein
MGKHMVSIRLLSVITVVALVAGMSAVSAVAAGPAVAHTAASAVAASPAGADSASSSLTPCTTPLFGPDKDCESTSPLVDRWVTFPSGAESCTYTMYVDWGDGTSSQRTFVDPSPGVTLLIDSHTYGPETQTTTYTETVTSSVNSGTCINIDTTIFHITHLLSAVAPWQPGLGISQACLQSLLEGIGVATAERILATASVFALLGAPDGLDAALFFVIGGFLVVDLVHTCVEHSTTGLSFLPSVFAYGASHPGKVFKPAGKVLQPPQITGIYGYQKGSLVYFSLTYSDPDHDAKGFGFVGINGAGWTEENHPFSSPSYGIVGNDRIDYPFNLACGTSQQYKSWVEAWIYDSQGIRSNPVEIALTCTT